MLESISKTDLQEFKTWLENNKGKVRSHALLSSANLLAVDPKNYFDVATKLVDYVGTKNGNDLYETFQSYKGDQDKIRELIIMNKELFINVANHYAVDHNIVWL